MIAAPVMGAFSYPILYNMAQEKAASRRRYYVSPYRAKEAFFMAVYKSIYCYPFSENANIASVFPYYNTSGAKELGEPFYFSCRVDTSNKNVVGYSIKIYNDGGEVVFPVNGAEPKISPVAELPKFTDDDSINSGINGTYLKIPFFQEYDRYKSSGSPYTGSFNALYCNETAYYTDYFMVDLILAAKFPTSVTGEVEPTVGWDNCWNGWDAATWTGPLTPQVLGGRTWDGLLNGVKVTKDHVIAACVYSNVSGKNEWHLFRLNAAGNGLEMIPDPSPNAIGVATWVANKQYHNGDIVVYSNVLYKANTDIMSGLIPSASSAWDEIYWPSLTHACFVRYGTHAGIYALDPLVATSEGGKAEMLTGFWFPATGGDPITQFLMNGSSYSWEITLYQGPDINTVSGLQRANNNSASGLTSFPYLYDIDIFKMPGDWFDMSLGQGQIMGSTATRLQLSDLSGTYLPGEGFDTAPVLQNKYVSVGTVSIPTEPETEAAGVWRIDSEEFVATATAPVPSASVSLGHVYPQDGQLTESEVSQSRYALFYKYSSNEEEIYERDIVQYVIGEAINLSVQYDQFAVGDRILLTAQALAQENGVYVYQESPLEGKYFVRAADCSSWANYIGRTFYARNRRENYSCNAAAGGVIDETPLYFYPQQPIKLFKTENNSYFNALNIKNVIYDITGALGTDKNAYIGQSFHANNFRSLTQYGMPSISAANGNYIAVGLKNMRVPVKGDIVALKPNGTTEQLFRVLKSDNGIATLMGLSPVSVARYSSTDNTYEGSYVDTYLNQTWSSSFTASFKAAMIPSEIGQDSWYDNGTSGNPVYTGIKNNGSTYKWSLGEGTVDGHTFSRYVYALSFSEVIDYLNIAPSNDAATGLTAEALRSMFLASTNASTIFLRSRMAANTTNVVDVYPYYWSVGNNTYSQTGRTVRPVFRVDLSRVEYRLVPSKGDVVWLNLDGTRRKYRVLSISDDLQYTKLLGMFSLGNVQFGNNNAVYSSGSGVYSTLYFWNLTQSAMNAMRKQSADQYGWSIRNSVPSSSSSYIVLDTASSATSYLVRTSSSYPYNYSYYVEDQWVMPLSIEDIANYFNVQYSTSGSAHLNSTNILSLVFDYSDSQDLFWLLNNDQSTASVSPEKALVVNNAGVAIGTNTVTESRAVRPVVEVNLGAIDYTFDESVLKKGDVLHLTLDGTARDYLVLGSDSRYVKLMTRTSIGTRVPGGDSIGAIVSGWVNKFNAAARNALHTIIGQHYETWAIDETPPSTPVQTYYQERQINNTNKIHYLGYSPQSGVTARAISMRDIIDYLDATPGGSPATTALRSSNLMTLWDSTVNVALYDNFQHDAGFDMCFNKNDISYYYTNGATVSVLAVFELDMNAIELPQPISQTRAVIRAMRFQNGSWGEITLPSPNVMSCYFAMPNNKDWDGTETPLGDQYGGKSKVRPFTNVAMSCASILEDPTREQLLSLIFTPLRLFIGDAICRILKNGAGKTYISANQNLTSGNILHLLGGKTVTTSGGRNITAIRITSVNQKFWSVTHETLASPYFISYKTDNGTPFKYDALCGSMTSSANAFTDYTVPFLAFSDVSDGSVMIDSSSYNAIGNYYQGQSASWESYRFVLKDVNGAILQDTGEKYDKEMKTWFLGLDADSAYYINFIVTDDIGYRVTYTVPLYTSSREFQYPYSGSFDTDRGLLTAELDCPTHSVLITYNGVSLPVYERGTLSLYRREVGNFARPVCDGTGRIEYAQWYGDWHPVAINTEEFAIRDFNVAQGHSYQYAIFPKDLDHKKLFANQGHTGFNVQVNVSSPNGPEFMVQPREGGAETERFLVRDEEGMINVYWDEWAIVDLVPEDSKVLLEDTYVEVPAIKKRYRALYENTWLLKYGAEMGSLEQNITRGETQTLGKYDRMGYSPRNFTSGSVSCYLGSEIAPLNRQGYVERPRASYVAPTSSNEASKLVALWKAFAQSSNPKLLTDRKGQKWIVQITSTSVTPQETYVGLPCKISFNWKQIEDCDDNIIIYGDGDDAIAPGEKPVWEPVFDYGRR